MIDFNTSAHAIYLTEPISHHPYEYYLTIYYMSQIKIHNKTTILWAYKYSSYHSLESPHHFLWFLISWNRFQWQVWNIYALSFSWHPCWSAMMQGLFLHQFQAETKSMHFWRVRTQCWRRSWEGKSCWEANISRIV